MSRIMDFARDVLGLAVSLSMICCGLSMIYCGDIEKSVSSGISPPASMNGVIRAVTENAYPPLNFINEKGEGVGIEYDITNKIAEMAGMRVEWNLSSWDVMLQSVREGMYDVGMDGISITDERRKEVDFSIPFLKFDGIGFVRVEEKRFSTLKEFVENKDLKIASQLGTTQFDQACKLLGYSPESPGSRIVIFEGFGASIKGLITGDVDMVLSGGFNTNRHIKSSKGRIRVLDEIIPSIEEGIGFVFQKGSPLVATFNEAIEKLKTDGTIGKIIDKWVIK